MPYSFTSFTQILLTVLFDLVAAFGLFFVLIACAAEASQRKAHAQSWQSSQSSRIAPTIQEHDRCPDRSGVRPVRYPLKPGEGSAEYPTRPLIFSLSVESLPPAAS